MYTMKQDSDGVTIKNGAPGAPWTTPIFDTATGRVYKSQKEVCEKLGMGRSKVSLVVNGELEGSLRRATAQEVQGAFKIKSQETEVSDVAYRVRGDGRVECRRPEDVKWGVATAQGDKVYVSLAMAAEDAGVSRSTVSKKSSKGEDGWRWATEAEVLKANPGARRIHAEARDFVENEEAETSFMAVTWPDGQVTVRARVGPWQAHYASLADVPAGVMEAAKVLV